jgi:hypothetical protein
VLGKPSHALELGTLQLHRLLRRATPMSDFEDDTEEATLVRVWLGLAVGHSLDLCRDSSNCVPHQLRVNPTPPAT